MFRHWPRRRAWRTSSFRARRAWTARTTRGRSTNGPKCNLRSVDQAPPKKAEQRWWRGPARRSLTNRALSVLWPPNETARLQAPNIVHIWVYKIRNCQTLPPIRNVFRYCYDFLSGETRLRLESRSNTFLTTNLTTTMSSCVVLKSCQI